MAFTIRIFGPGLIFGAVPIPLQNAYAFSVADRRAHRIDLHLNHHGYETTLKLFLETAENLRTCIQVLTSYRELKQGLFYISSITPHLEEEQTVTLELQFANEGDLDDFDRYTYGWRGLDCRLEKKSEGDHHVAFLTYNQSEKEMKIRKIRSLFTRLAFKFIRTGINGALRALNHPEFPPSEEAPTLPLDPDFSREYSIGRAGAFDPSLTLGDVPMRIPIPWEEVVDWLEYPHFQLEEPKTTGERIIHLLDRALQQRNQDKQQIILLLRMALAIPGLKFSLLLSPGTGVSKRKIPPLRVATS